MSSISKSFALILILTMVISGTSFLIVKPTRAQTSAPTPAVPLPTPSVPQFTVKFVGPSYIVNTTYSLDPNTGKIVPHYGYYVEYGTLEIIIKNQPFKPVTVPGQTDNLYYYVQSKLHSAKEWTYWFEASDGYPTQNSSSEYTILSYGWDGSQITTNARSVDIPSSSQLDFEVQALNGYITRVLVPGAALPPWEFVGESSGSSTQTITTGAVVSYTPSPSSPALYSPTAPAKSTSSSFLLIATISLVIIAFLLAVIIFLLIYMRKRSRFMGVNLKGYVSISYE